LRRIIHIWTLIVALSQGINAQGSEEHPLEILFIGNSYFAYNTFPTLFEELAIHAGQDVFVDAYTPAGTRLHDHANSPTTEAKIMERKWDFIVFMGSGATLAYPQEFKNTPVYPSILELKKKVYSNCAATRFVYCMPWAYEDGMTWMGWPDTYEDMQLKIYEKTLEYSGKTAFTIAPVGWVWDKVLKEYNFPLHYLHREDWSHPTIKGSYLMACVVYSTLFIESSAGNTYYNSVDESEAAYFQEIASSTVLDDTLLWSITTYTDTTFTTDGSSSVTPSSSGNQSILSQNFPNPFHTYTSIPYSITEHSNVEIKLYDVSGRFLSTLFSGLKPPGEYLLPFSAENYSSGIYFYTISTSERSELRKMQLVGKK